MVRALEGGRSNLRTAARECAQEEEETRFIPNSCMTTRKSRGNKRESCKRIVFVSLIGIADCIRALMSKRRSSESFITAASSDFVEMQLAQILID